MIEKSGKEIASKADVLTQKGLTLTMEKEGLTLSDGELSLRGDFTGMKKRLHPANLRHELIVKTARLRNMENMESAPVLLDATAGLGEDSLLLAAAGFKVMLYERDPVIAALLADALHRAESVPELKEATGRMSFSEGDSIKAMKNLPFRPDVILLDPMFPERRKSGLIKKKFQLLQKLEQPCTDEKELLEAAISAKPQKVLIKRPLKGPYLGGITPSYSKSGGTIRYDCLVFSR